MRTFETFLRDAEIEVLVFGFLNRSLPRERWTHATHFAAAMWMIVCRPEWDTLAEMRKRIRAYNKTVGVQNTETAGYHETITAASVRAAKSFFQQYRGYSLCDTCNALMRSPLGSSKWPLEYWSRDLLFSTQARKEWVEPDLKPVPWTL